MHPSRRNWNPMTDYGPEAYGNPYGPPGAPYGPPPGPYGAPGPTGVPSVEGALHSRATVNGPTMQSVYADGAMLYRLDIPTPSVPKSPNVALQTRDYVLNFSIATANATQTLPVRCDIPCVLFAKTASARLTTGNLPGGVGTRLDMFRCQISHNTGDLLETAPVLGSCLFGDGGNPSWLVGPGWKWDRGGQINVIVTSLYANLEVDIMFGILELRATNYDAG